MVQEDHVNNIGASQLNEIWGKNVNVTLSTTFANVLVIDNIRKIKDIAIHIGNEDGSIAENYLMMVSNNPDADPSDLTTTDWFEKVASNSLAAGDTEEILVTQPYAKIVIQMNSASATPNASLYYRGLS